MQDEHKKISFTVNGEEKTVEARAGASLLDLLRDELRLTGAKNGCDKGFCGSCTVIMNGKGVTACTIKPEKAAGAELTTVEGLASGTEDDLMLDALQQAFIDEAALQCGYCIPGLIVAGKALLSTNPDPTDDEIKTALLGNLCRCTGYTKPIAAIKRAAKHLQTNQPTMDKVKVVGERAKRKDALDIVTGKALYCDDMYFDNMLYGKTLRAAYPHARILSIDTEEAEKAPGVVAVLTAKDIPGKNAHGLIKQDWPALCGDKVRYMGDAVAVVAAETKEQAEAALNLIKVEYEPLLGLFDPAKALEPDAPLVHNSGNSIVEVKYEKGNIEEAFVNAAIIVEKVYQTQFIEHAFIEPESGIGIPDGEGGVIVYVGSQNPFEDRKQMSEVLAMPEEKIRIVHTMTGGAFGGKEDISVQIHLAMLALKTGRPVKMTYSREESILFHPKRHPITLHYKTAADSQGNLLAMDIEMLGDGGAYCSLSVPVLQRATVHCCGPYVVPNVRVHSQAVYTNNPPTGAMRGFGVSQSAFAVESQLDLIAEKLGIDPLEIRERNALEVAKETGTGQVMKASVGLKETIRRAREVAQQWPAVPFDPEKERIGIGVACAYKNTGLGTAIDDHGGARVQLEADGQVTIRFGTTEIGQGIATTVAQITAEEGGFDYEDVIPINGDTGETPDGGPTTASRSAFISGNAALMAARQARQTVTTLVARKKGLEPSQCRIAGGRFYRSPEDTEGELLRPYLQALANEGVTQLGEAVYHAPDTAPIGQAKAGQDLHFAYGFATQIIRVKVDLKSGKTQVLDVAAAVDVGRALNPALIEGQVEGSVSMGLGYALTEELIVQEGITKNLNFNKYRIPNARTQPNVVTILVEDTDPNGPHGAKGVAELPSIPTLPAIINAIYYATGVRVTHLPATPAKIVAGFTAKKELAGTVGD